MSSPFLTQMGEPDPNMDRYLSTLLRNALGMCPGHMHAYSTNGFRTLDNMVNTTMTTLHHLSLQTEYIDDYFGNRSDFSTGQFSPSSFSSFSGLFTIAGLFLTSLLP